LIQGLMLLAASGIVVGYGIYGYFVPAAIRVGFAAYQVGAVLGFIVIFLAIEFPIFRGAKSLGEIQWGKMPGRSQYVLFFLAMTFTWLMGLMGYIRQRLHTHPRFRHRNRLSHRSPLLPHDRHRLRSGDAL
jgi:signal transduction histidine kinase